jgi:hypothetical protein
MNSASLAEYLSTGVISPLRREDQKSDVEQRLGPPNDWKGRIQGIGWDDPPIANFHDAGHWQYGALTVSFDQADRFTDIFLDYSGILTPTHFPAVFADLPQCPFSLTDLLALLDASGISYNRQGLSDPALVTGAGIAAAASDALPTAPILFLYSFHNDTTCA